MATRISFLLLTKVILVFGDIIWTGDFARKHLDANMDDDDRSMTWGDHFRIIPGDNGVNFSIFNNGVDLLTGVIGRNADTTGVKECQLDGAVNGSGLCLQSLLGHRLEIYDQHIDTNSSDFQCVTVNWTLPEQADLVDDTPEDCYSMKEYLWYGGFEESSQPWPLKNLQTAFAPFITNEGNKDLNYGSVIEGIFISSAGVGIFINETTPLYLSINDTRSQLICLKGKVGMDTPFFQRKRPHLLYDICRSGDISTLWRRMANRYIPKPQSYPSPDVIRYPIWTTWAVFKGNINQSLVLEYGQSIKTFNFSISQLEIDDNWTPHYGDFIFNTKTFPDAKEMIAKLTDLGIRVTVWVHWFFNTGSDAFKELNATGYLIKNYDIDQALLVPWWRGDHAGVLDVTNSDAVKWYLDKLEALTQNYNVTSFKFDAGEVKWLNNQRYKVKEDIWSPNEITKKYSEMAYQADTTERRQEVRAGFRSQGSSNMVRMLDRNSDWSHDLGIKSLIPCSLSFGMMGYPFILPDLIGGNAYGSGGIDASVQIEPELLIRWLQVNVFLPVLQFSVGPWAYKNATITEITHKFVQLHERYADKIIDLAKNAVQTGHPIIRPLWWIAPTDKDALTQDSEFLLGDDLLVAPVLDKGARSRDIYLPAGQWYDELRGVTLVGNTWLKGYHADLDELPYFTKVN